MEPGEYDARVHFAYNKKNKLLKAWLVLYGNKKGEQRYTAVAWLKYPAVEVCEEYDLPNGVPRLTEMLWEATECALRAAGEENSTYLDTHFHCYPNPCGQSKSYFYFRHAKKRNIPNIDWGVCIDVIFHIMAITFAQGVVGHDEYADEFNPPTLLAEMHDFLALMVKYFKPWDLREEEEPQDPQGWPEVDNLQVLQSHDWAPNPHYVLEVGTLSSRDFQTILNNMMKDPLMKSYAERNQLRFVLRAGEGRRLLEAAGKHCLEQKGRRKTISVPYNKPNKVNLNII